MVQRQVPPAGVLWVPHPHRGGRRVLHRCQLAICRRHPLNPAVQQSMQRKTVRLWIGNPFGWPTGGPPNQVAFCIVLAELEKLRDVVDEITLTGYYLADPSTGNMSTGGLLRSEGTLEVVQALRKAGWHKIHAMIGGCPLSYGGTNGSIDVYRHYVTSPEFLKAVVDEVTEQRYAGINIDFEPSDCLKQPTVPCGVADCTAMSNMLYHLKTALGSRVMVSVDTGQSPLASTSCLNSSLADRLISMNSYYDRKSFDISLPRDIAAVGVQRYGMGVCPTCSTPLCKAPSCASNLSDITERIDLATQAGVRHIDFWASAKQPDWAYGPEWWAAIRNWKGAALAPAAVAGAAVPLLLLLVRPLHLRTRVIGSSQAKGDGSSVLGSCFTTASAFHPHGLPTIRSPHNTDLHHTCSRTPAQLGSQAVAHK